MPTRPAVIALAVAPFAVLLYLIIALFTDLPLLGVAIANLSLFIPLTLLSLTPTPDLPASARTTLRLTLPLFLLLLPAAAMHLAPRYLLNPDRGPAGISLIPARYETPFKDAVDVLGLSTRDEPMLEHWPASEHVPSDFRAKVWINSGWIPCTLVDGQGNSISFSLSSKNTVHLADTRGGSADVTWTGTQFTLASSTPATQSPSARGPTPRALSLQKTGRYLLTLTPFLACLAITLSSYQRNRATNLPTTPLKFAAILQLLGLANLTWFLLLWNPRPGDEMNIIGVLFSAIVSLATFGPAFSLLAHSLLRKPATPALIATSTHF